MQAQLINRMRTLRLHGMASTLEESLTALSQKKLAPTSWLGQMREAEHADRQARSFRNQMCLARLPVLKELDSFDFREPLVNETAVRQLFSGQYEEGSSNVVLVGGTGIGSSGAEDASPPKAFH